MTLRARLTLAIAGITILLIGPAIYAVSRLSDVVDIAQDQRAKQAATYLTTGGLQTRLARLDQRQRSYVAIPTDDSLRASMLAARDSVRAKLMELEDAGFTQYAEEAGRSVEAVLAAGARADSLITAGALEEATAHLDETRPLFVQAQATADRIADRVERETAAALVEADDITQTAKTTTLATLLACVALAILIGARTTRKLTRPVVRLDGAMAAVADGQFSVPDDLPYERHDEIGSVSRSFRSMTLRLAELDQMKAEFMSIATHELKTPLNVISGYAELLEERVYGDVNERQSEALAAVRDQARILTVLVNQLLDISRLEAGGLRVQVRDVELQDLFSRIRRSFGPLAEQKHIRFEMELDASLPDAIRGDADRLRDQVFGNVLSNAVKFTPEEGHITVRAHSAGETVVIEVEDTGPGIPNDKLPHIFDKFYQVGDHARSKGAGLGLAIAREIVDAHGGRIGAHCPAAGGTTFRIELPADGATPPPHEPAATHQTAA